MFAQSAAARAARLLVYACAVALVVIPGPSLRAQNGGAAKGSPNGATATPVEPNYDPQRNGRRRRSASWCSTPR
jgi:hypothetical protein